MAKQPDTCDHEGCEELGDIYRYADNHLAVLCDAHAPEAGFCPFCGVYVRGDEEHDLALIFWGMCADCAMETADELLPIDPMDNDWDEPFLFYGPDED